MQSKYFAQDSFYPIAHDGVADAARDCHAEPRGL